MLVSFLTSLPIAYYFLGAKNGWRLVGVIPVMTLLLTVIYYRRGKTR